MKKNILFLVIVSLFLCAYFFGKDIFAYSAVQASADDISVGTPMPINNLNVMSLLQKGVDKKGRKLIQ